MKKATLSQAMAYDHGYRQGWEQERERIVAWLRGRGSADGADFLADMIEAGEHLK